MSSKATKEQLDWVVSLVERYEGYGGLLLQWIVAGGKFDRIHLKVFGSPCFGFDQLNRVSMVRSWLEQAVRLGRLKRKDCAVVGAYHSGDVPFGYYSIRAVPSEIMAVYERERADYAGRASSVDVVALSDDVVNFKKDDVMRLLNEGRS